MGAWQEEHGTVRSDVEEEGEGRRSSALAWWEERTCRKRWRDR
jgi:hypothetical protein